MTSYASYVIDIAVDALQDVDLSDPDSVALSRGVLRTIRAAFEHDQDGKIIDFISGYMLLMSEKF